MRILSVFVSFNRIELLRRALASYADTVTFPHDVVIVDCGSGAETRDWLSGSGYTVLLLPANRHIGYAANRGFRLRDERHLLLHRSDNDVLFRSGWCEAALGRLEAEPAAALCGLRTDEGDDFAENPGGNMVILASAWDAGLRYSDDPWELVPWSDARLTENAAALGFGWTRVLEPGIVHLGSNDPTDPYYRATMRARGIEVEG